MQQKILRLNKIYYSENAVSKTSDAFKAITTTKVEDEDTHMKIILCPKKDIDTEILAKEFANYCLAMSKPEINSSAFSLYLK